MLLGVVMNYKVESNFNFNDADSLLVLRINKWAQKYNFKLLENIKDNKFIYKRGSHFRASCSFDVRYVPTIVTIEYLENKINVSFWVKSHFYHAMPTDNSRIDEQLELLIAYLKGSFDENLDYVVKI